MDIVLRSVFVYVVLLVLIRLSGRRTLGQMTSFDLLLILIISGSTQRALLGQDYSVTVALIVVVTLITTDVLFSLLGRDFPRLGRIMNGSPMIIVEEGRVLEGRLRHSRLRKEDVLTAARRTHGLESLEQIKFAILEAGGAISIIPYGPRERAPTTGTATR